MNNKVKQANPDPKQKSTRQYKHAKANTPISEMKDQDIEEIVANLNMDIDKQAADLIALPSPQGTRRLIQRVKRRQLLPLLKQDQSLFERIK